MGTFSGEDAETCQFRRRADLTVGHRIRYLLSASVFLLTIGITSTAEEHPGRFRTEIDKLLIKPRYGAGYTPETQVSFIGGINGTYRTACDIRIPYSSFDILAGISTNLSIFADIDGTWYSPYADTSMEGFMIRYGGSFRYTPRRFYGIGYASGTAGRYGQFRETSFRLRTDPLFRITGNLYLGPTAAFEFIKLTEFQHYETKDHVERYSSFSLGAHLEFDSRDSRLQTHKGLLLKLEQTVSPAFNYNTGLKTIITADIFCPLWKGAVLAFDIYGHLNNKSSYWMTWEQVGDGTRMRGYYTGRYRDRNFLCLQTELRQNFTDVHGAVIWAGGGNIFPEFSEFDISKTLPTLGAGYRLNLPGMILRFDFGFGSAGQWGVTAGAGHAF